MARRKPRPVTARTLQWWTSRYFERYMTTRAHLRRLLLQRIRKRDQDPDALGHLVDAELDRCESLGVLDDSRYAVDRVRSLHRRGASIRKMRAALASKGLSGEAIDAAVATLRDHSDDPDWQAVLTWARKRRLGPWSQLDLSDRDVHTKQLGKLGRAGFPYEVSRRVLALTAPP